MIKKLWSRARDTIGRSSPKLQSNPPADTNAPSSNSTEPDINQEAERSIIIEQSNLAVTFFGLPTSISVAEQQAIAKEVLQHFAQTSPKAVGYEAGDILHRGYFFVEHNHLRQQVNYELKVLRFLTAMQIYKEALDLVRNQQVQGTLDSEVADITQKHLRTLAQQELDHVRGTPPTPTSPKFSATDSTGSTRELMSSASEVSSHDEPTPQLLPEEIAGKLSDYGKESSDGNPNQRPSEGRISR